MSNRKLAFSGAQRKKQIQEKRLEKANRPSWTANETERKEWLETNRSLAVASKRPKKFDIPFSAKVKNSTRNRYNMDFGNEKNDSEAKKNNDLPITTGQWADLEFCSASVFPSNLDFPRRPKWHSNDSKEQLDESESLYMKEFISKYEDIKKINRFERNLETWRQLWRVCEKSDILLIIVDARFAIAHFPPYLYHYINDELKKGVILILNKCDLIPNICVNSLKDYFSQCFPDMLLVPFSSGKGDIKWSTNKEKRLQLLKAIKKISKINVHFDNWECDINSCEIDKGKDFDDAKSAESLPKTILTIGTIGNPNVGKSSFINTIMLKKVVSVSKTPGHTKHFQTIYLTKDIVLCDCPGLVFPSTTPFSLQVLMGSYPTAQVRNPIAVIGFICQYIDIPQILQLTFPDDSSDDGAWTPLLVCEAFAIKKGFMGKNGRPQVYRGANLLLREAVSASGKIIFYIRPPGSSYKDKHGLNRGSIERETIIADDENGSQNSSAKDSDDECSNGRSLRVKTFSNRFASLDCQ